MKEIVIMLNDLCEKYGIAEEDITPVARKIGELAGPAAIEELQAAAGGQDSPDEGGEFDDLAAEEE